MYEFKAEFRFFDELNDFLSEQRKNKTLTYQFNKNPSIKDSIESHGVPHTEVELILVNGGSVGFDYHMKDGDKVKVYPDSEGEEIPSKVKLRDVPKINFVLDVHLGKLARILRLLGFDALYRNDYDDHEIVSIAENEERIVLTRDRKLLRFKAIEHGYWLRSTNPNEQILEVAKRYNLYLKIEPFHRCLECNGIIQEVNKESIIDQLEPKTKIYFEEFFECIDCNKIYWKGSHYDHMVSYIDQLME